MTKIKLSLGTLVCRSRFQTTRLLAPKLFNGNQKKIAPIRINDNQKKYVLVLNASV